MSDLIQEYESKPRRIRAVKWDGSVEAMRAIERMIGRPNVYDGEGTSIMVWNAPEKQRVPVPLGCYVCHTDDGDNYPMAEEKILSNWTVVT
jgi:hypothetical protein